MPRELKNLRNIGIVAHIDAGKTTVTERMLFASGAKHRAGEVDKGTTTTDDDVEEAERGITIYSACVAFDWKGAHVNLIDTPGHVDFTAEVERSLRVLDGAVVVFSAREGVEAQSETVWRQANKYKVPRLTFINKLDREGAGFEETLEEMRVRLGANPVAVQIPLGLGPAHTPDPFRGVIDLIAMRLLTFPNEAAGKEVAESPIPEEALIEAKLWRERMLEQLYDYSNELMELALAEEEIPEELIRKTLRDATVHLQAQPVLCGSALHGQGIQPLLDAVAAYLPSPLDIPPVVGVNPRKKDAKETRKPDPKEPFCGLVFKVLPFKTGDMFWVRIYSGTLKPNTRVYNPGKDKKENAAQLWRIHASKRDQQLQVAEAGDIVAVIGLRDSITGDTICDSKAPILLEKIEFPQTVISMAVEPESTADRKKLSDTLDMMKRQDPTFQASENEETGQTLISGMGELHLEVIKHRLLREYKLNLKVRNPRVSYRETIEKAVEVAGECDRLMAGQQLFAREKIRMEPFDTDPKTPVIVTVDPDSKLLGDYLDAALEVLKEQATGGGSLGFPLMKAKITVLDGEADETRSNEVAFRIAAADALNKAIQAGGIVLLEPIMKLEILTPDEHVGDFVSDLQQRRAIIHNTAPRGRNTLIEADAPLANLFGYTSAMRSLSQGRGSCSMQPKDYGPAPPEVLERFL
jgi:elongation factor G